MKKFVLLIALATLISGCSTVTPNPVPVTVNTKPPLNLVDPSPVDMPHVHWNVATPSNVKLLYSKLNKNHETQALISLDVDDYRKLTISLGKLRSYISKQRAEVQAYKDYYESSPVK